MQIHHEKKSRSKEDTEASTPPISQIPSFDFFPHTIFLLCGPTHSGKSTFTQDLAYLAEYCGLTFRDISSDGIRRGLLSESTLSPYAGAGPDSRYSAGMSAVSEQAFTLLMAELKACTSFPISTQIVVVDTTGMDELFRKSVKQIGYESGYRTVLVTFEYKARSDYIPEEGLSEKSKVIVDRSVAKFRRNVLPFISARDFDGRIRIKSREGFGWDIPRNDFWWDDSSIEIWVEKAFSEKSSDKLKLLESCSQINYNRKSNLGWASVAEDNAEKDGVKGAPVYAVIGDSHECVEELTSLISLVEEKYPSATIVHVGDYLDKGGDTAGMIALMQKRVSKGDIVVRGNHENFVARRLTGALTPLPEVEAEFFTSLKVLEKDPALTKKFLEIYDASLPFAILCDYDTGGGLPVFVTHAPCEVKHLGKVHDHNIRAQANYRIADRSKPILEELDWLFEEANRSHPLHIFGHVSHEVTSGDEYKSYVFQNKVFLDTGVVHGCKLSAAIVSEGRILSFLSVPATKVRYPSELPRNLGQGPDRTKPFRIEDYDLDSRDLRLLSQVMEKGVKYISGTMAPAPSSESELEPLEGAFDWFKKMGVDEVVLQPKYMGSRCQMYLFKDGPDKTFATSRSGWVIRGVEGQTEEEYKAFLTSVWNEHSSLVNTVGDVILDGELLPWSALGAGLIHENFVPYQALVKNQLDTLTGDVGFNALTEFKNKFKLEEKQVHLSKFEEALSKYSGFVAPSFKAFDILYPKMENATSAQKWVEVNNDMCLTISLSSQENIDAAKNFFRRLTVESGMEGVVVKPLIPTPNSLPYMKVRSEEYLRLVYGYDYLEPTRYEKLVRQKNISGKVRVSIFEHETALAMLNSEGDFKKELIVKMIGQMKVEKTLDPRL